MEDCNAFAGDCVVISCCCQCLILQILIIFLVRLPYKLLRKTVYYTAKKLSRKYSKNKKKIKIVHTRRKIFQQHDSPCKAPQRRSLASNDQCHRFQDCIDEEIDKVLEEFYLRGQFGFGRFWDREEEVSSSSSSSSSSFGNFPTCLGNYLQLELDYDVVSYHLLQKFGSGSSSDLQSLIL